MVRRGVWLMGGLLGVGLALGWVLRPGSPDGALPRVALGRPLPPPAPPEDKAAAAPGDDVRSHAFRLPAGQAPALACDAARAIVSQARAQLAYGPDPVDPRAFAEAAADWLDPYGLWSVAPDTPIGTAFDRHAADLLADVEGRGGRDCVAARALGAQLVGWVAELRATFDEANARPASGESVDDAASAPAFEGTTVTRPARALAATLGRRIGVIERELGAAARPYLEAARARYFPALSEDGWAEVVLAAAVRAYVPMIDPHGAWAPLDEESSVYEVDLEARPPSRLWDKAERTAVGMKIESGAAPPLADGDVLLSLAGVPTAGLSFEQSEQLGFAASDARPPAQAIVLRAGESAPLTTWLDGASVESKASSSAGEPDDELPVERIEYGDADAIIVTIHDVRDDLGDELTRALLRERSREGRTLAGVVLDLRGNGGGSTDGAIDALGLFVAGAPLFPMKRRDGTLETDRAPEPPSVDRWRGPMATLVDGDTASAAEMIAGAIAAYRRGPAIGATTFGKGCAQEYVDDDVHAGVLRLTTLVYALPDGTPVQRIGLTPNLRFPFGTTEPSDREAALLHAAPAWHGPDVRDRGVLAHADDGTWTTAWPPHGGNVGPCKDGDACRALRLLGAAPPTARRTTAAAKGR
jgi:carboxyl-terminal processing protease